MNHIRIIVLFLINIVFSQNNMTPPAIPEILGVADDGSVTVTWNRIAESSIDPKTGYPTTNNVVSATIIATHCIDADALATIANIMSVDKTINLINKLDGVECLVVERIQEGMKYYYSKNMKDYIN